MANADYSIDRSEIETLIAWLNAMTTDIDALNGGGTGTLTDMTLDGVTIHAGSDLFAPGKRVKEALVKLGKDVLDRLDNMSSNGADLAVKLQAALDKAERVENLNQLSASEFGAFKPPVTTGSGHGSES